jgi:hypothetical protein
MVHNLGGLDLNWAWLGLSENGLDYIRPDCPFFHFHSISIFNAPSQSPPYIEKMEKRKKG